MLHVVELKVRDIWLPTAVFLTPNDAGVYCEGMMPSETRIKVVYGKTKLWELIVR